MEVAAGDITHSARVLCRGRETELSLVVNLDMFQPFILGNLNPISQTDL